MRNISIKAGLAAAFVAASLTGASAHSTKHFGEATDHPQPDLHWNEGVSIKPSAPGMAIQRSRYAEPVYDSNHPKPDLHWNEGASIKPSKQPLSLQQSRSARPVDDSGHPKPDLHWNEGASID